MNNAATYSMKTVKIISRTKAQNIQKSTLGGTLLCTRYDMGKYNPERFPIGREIDVLDHIEAVYKEHRKDSYGPYIVLYCLYK